MPKKPRKKKRTYTKVELLETSAVGIPAYPDAHLSFIKALLGTGDQLNKQEEDNMPEDQEIEQDV